MVFHKKHRNNFENQFRKTFWKKKSGGKKCKKNNTEPAVINTSNLRAKMMKNLRKKQSN